MAEELSDFPVLVRLDASVFDYARAEVDGSDLRFVAGDGVTELAHEIERFAPGGASYLWVRVPRILADSDQTTIWLYFGNPAPGSARPPSELWQGHAAVWHLNEPLLDGQTTGTVVDATSHGNHGAQIRNAGVAGYLAGGQDFRPNDYVRIPDASSLDITGAITLSAWFRLPVTNSGYSAFVSKYELGSDQRSYSLYLFDMQPRFVISPDGTDTNVFVTGTNDVSTGTWHYLVGTWDGTIGADALRLYLDGALVAQAAGPLVPTILSSPIDVQLGCSFFNGGLAQCIRALLDEVRITPVARSAAWVNAEYRSMSNAMISFGAPQARP